jgi:hypothetical protein
MQGRRRACAPLSLSCMRQASADGGRRHLVRAPSRACTLLATPWHRAAQHGKLQEAAPASQQLATPPGDLTRVRCRRLPCRVLPCLAAQDFRQTLLIETLIVPEADSSLHKLLEGGADPLGHCVSACPCLLRCTARRAGPPVCQLGVSAPPLACRRRLATPSPLRNASLRPFEPRRLTARWAFATRRAS